MNGLLDILRTLASESPDRPALIGDEQRLTYSQLWEQIQVLSDRLLASGWTRVGLAGDNTPAWAVADLACLNAGIINIPLPGFFSGEQRSHIQKQAALEGMLFVSGDNEDIQSGVRMSALSQPENAPGIPPGTAKITFTSGSTGQPKGVCLSAENQDRTACALQKRLQGIGIQRHLSLLPLATLLENVAGVYLPLRMGAEICLPSLAGLGFSGSSQLDPSKLAKGIVHWNPDSLILVPELARILVLMTEQEHITPYSLKFIAVGGGKVAPGLLERAHILGLPLYEGYGLSECGSVVALNVPGDNHPGHVGRVLDHVRVTCDVQGEVHVSGNAHLGYLGESTAPDACLPTGDLGQIDQSGLLTIHGRAKNLLITAFGRNVNPEWLESELQQALPLKQAMVVGDGEVRLSALVYAPESVPNDDLISALVSLNTQLPDYAQLKQLHRLQKPLDVASNYLTPNGRMKRQTIHGDLTSLMQSAITLSLSDTGEHTMSFFDRLQTETAEARKHVTEAPIIEGIQQGRLGRAGYIEFLVQAYHHVKHTAPLMMACGGRLPERLEFVRKALVEYIEEEYGHHEWILNDIKACGGNAEAVRQGKPGQAIELMVAYLYDQINRGNPMTLFGMVQVLEGTSVELATPLGQCLQKTLGLPNQAFSYLYSHGSLDLEHFDFFRDLMNKVTEPKDQEAIIEGARMVYRLYGDMLRNIPLLSNEEVLHDEVA